MPTVAETVSRYVELLGSGTAGELVALFAPDATVEDPVGSDVRHGHDEIRDLYDRIEKQDRTVELVSLHVNGNEAAFLARLTVMAGDSHDPDRRDRRHDIRRRRPDHLDAGVLVGARRSLIGVCLSASVG